MLRAVPAMNSALLLQRHTALVVVLLACVLRAEAAATPIAADPPQIEVEARFYEIPAASLRRVRRAAEAAVAEDRSALDYLAETLADSAPRQVLTPAQCDTITAFLASRTDVDAVSAPRVTTKPGQRAVIEIIRELRWPVEWKRDPANPKPLTPVAFETNNCGMTMEIEPGIRGEELVALWVKAQLVEFLGAVDIEKGTAFPLRNPPRHLPDRALTVGIPLTHDRPTRAVFSRRAEETHADLLSGYGVLLAGLGEVEAVEPLKRAAPKGRLLVLVKARVIHPTAR